MASVMAIGSEVLISCVEGIRIDLGEEVLGIVLCVLNFGLTVTSPDGAVVRLR